MKIISDLHIHSRFSRATSQNLTIENLEKWARIKGLNLLGTGDFCHPQWIKELKQELSEDESGILKTKTGFNFLLTNEVSLMYNQDSKGRRVHLILLAPTFEVVEQITEYLKKRGRVDYDGRPIFNISCVEFAEKIMSISRDIEIIPAHIWTPWFGIFGSETGFNSIEEAFQEKVSFIHAVETGMSSDPEMNWRLSKLDNYSIISFSDSHSFWPWRLGREATIFDIKEINYREIIKAIRNKTIDSTIEVNPAYGKYHFDGHRFCKFSCSPEESKKIKNICPVCGKKLTIGVLNRVEELADREKGFKPENSRPFYSLLPLHEIISLFLKSSISSKKVWHEYNKLINAFENEFNILLNVSAEKLSEVVEDKLAKLIIKNRKNKIKVEPGFDGQYGRAILEEQKTLI